MAQISKIIKKTILASVIVILLLGNIFLAGQWLSVKLEGQSIREALRTQQINEKVLAFSKFFIDKVLAGSKEVSFEDRLKMENMVRDLNNQEILDQWQKFSQSQTSASAQKELVALLKLLMDKISY